MVVHSARVVGAATRNQLYNFVDTTTRTFPARGVQRYGAQTTRSDYFFPDEGQNAWMLPVAERDDQSSHFFEIGMNDWRMIMEQENQVESMTRYSDLYAYGYMDADGSGTESTLGTVNFPMPVQEQTDAKRSITSAGVPAAMNSAVGKQNAEMVEKEFEPPSTFRWVHIEIVDAKPKVATRNRGISKK